MNQPRAWSGRFRRLFLNNKFVLFLFIALLVGVNVLIFSKITFIFNPLLVLIKTIVLPIILTGVVYYVLNPIVDYMERKNVKRVHTILFLYVLIIGILMSIIMLIVPVIREQLLGFFQNFPAYSQTIQTEFEKWIGSDFVNQFQETTNLNAQEIASTLSERATTILNHTWTGIGGVLGVVKELVLAIVTLPFILFYLLKDGRKLPGYILSFVPSKLRPGTLTVLQETNHQISSYIRGQIIVSMCIGFLLYIGYRIIGLEYSLVLAIVAACTAIVPYLGPAIAITPAIIVAAVTSPIMLLKMVIVWTVVQLVEGKFISPQIMGKSLKIHPITIIFVILTAGNLFGVVGILLAVPGYAVLKVLATHVFDWFKLRSQLYL
ncbi:AI-2E family transporter [Saccharibacillus sp. CPCC 101409]|uniref:AI-2E family transporter n=1 Tax=Saccharibacillus sp. CPCC 101409 TaxID=3058041 RepID=UPI0026718951|nr:AI-2E family transporter [Saccharibacillus sp. CPCC 101409]MDO3412168.1 AI-2E family transporter [Saccharibacillus sp. CPCC 101409]